MYIKTDKSQKSRIKAVANSAVQKKSDGQVLEFVDNRALSIVQKKLQNIALANSGFNSSAVLQFVTEEQIATSLRNVAAYASDMYREYGAATIRAVLSAQNMTVRGHASGASGDSQNQATTDDLARLAAALREYHPPERKETATSRGKTGLHDSDEKMDERAAKKEKEKKEKAAKKRATFKAAKKEFFGKRPPKGGGGGSGVRV
jgi:hypothetical protein